MLTSIQEAMKTDMHDTILSKRSRLSSHELCTNTSTAPRPNWSDLQPDLLELIFQKLPAEDAIRFPAVCHSWELAAKSSVSSKCRPLSQQPPMLIFPNHDMSNRLFFSSSDKKVYNITNEFPEDEILLSSHGWLLMCKRQYNNEYSKGSYLFNPLSCAIIELPPIIHQSRLPVHSAAISADPSRNNNFIVVIVLSEYERTRVYKKTRMMFLKHGVSTRWEDLSWFHDDYAFQVNIIFYEHHFYVVSSDHIVVWDFQGSPSDPNKIEDFQISGLMIERSPYWSVWSTYSVESQGDILFVKQVKRRYYFDDFYVYRLNITEKKWEKLESLTGRAIFLQYKISTMALSTRNFPAPLEGNSIYYVGLYQKSEISKKSGCDMAAEFRILQYNLENKENNLYEKFDVKEPEGVGDYLLCPWILPDPVLHGEKEAQIK